MNIVEFAKKAGLSTATVSRAFHEPQKLRKETCERVLALAARLKYYPDPSGRALVKGRYDTLGLVWPLEVEGAAAVFAQRILAELSQQLVAQDLDLLICPVDRGKKAAMEHALRSLARSRCDGWIMLYPREHDILTTVLRQSGKPVVGFLGPLPAFPKWKSVLLDQELWVGDAVRRMKKAGVRKLLFLGCRQGEPDHAERLRAFEKITTRSFTGKALSLPEWPLDLNKLQKLILHEGVDGIIGVDDAAALAGLEAARRAGISVPLKLNIVGMDDSPEAARSSPRLATFRQPLGMMTAAAVAHARGGKAGNCLFKADFVAGESLG